MPRDREAPSARRGTAKAPAVSRRCGAHVMRCPACDQAVGPSAVRSGVNHYGPCASAAPFPSTCRQPVAEPGARCYFHGKGSPQAKGAATRRARQRVATKALGRVEQLEEARRQALRPFNAEIAAAEREAELGGADATLRLRRLARALRVASDQLYADARRRESEANR